MGTGSFSAALRQLVIAVVGKAACPLFLAGCGPGLPTEPLASDAVRCTDVESHVSCVRQQLALPTRNVQWQTPRGEPPAAGWPAVVIFHGSFMGTKPFWDAKDGDEWGAYRAAQTTMALLERGYVVITPESIHGGKWYWNTNVVGFADNWSLGADSEMMPQLLDAIAEGKMGRVDTTRLYATGISSGGFMTSRMAISYNGKFRALAIHSASYAKCSVTCSVPELPADHPPTLLVHGEKDSIVPISTMRAYETKLKEQGLTVEVEVDAERGHEWLPVAVTRIPDWFDGH